MDIMDRRLAEIAKYNRAYKATAYAMGKRRMDHAIDVLAETTSRDSYLDIGCGRGEMLMEAQYLGYKNIVGTEVVNYLVDNHYTETVNRLIDNPIVRFAIATDLPFKDNEFDTVSCFDVLEHLISDDIIPALQEINRVCAKQIILTANNKPSIFNGEDLHISKLAYNEWDKVIRKHIDGNVQWLPRTRLQISETWLVTKS